MNRFLAVAAARAVVASLGIFAASSSAAVIVYNTHMDGPTEGTASPGQGDAPTGDRSGRAAQAVARTRVARRAAAT